MLITYVTVKPIPLALLTFVKVFGRLAGVAAAIGAAFLLSRAFPVLITALYAGSSKTTGSLWRWTAALLRCQH